MNEIKRIREIKAVLESLLKEDLFVAIQEQRLHFLDTLEELLQRLQKQSLAMNNGNKLLPVLSEELENLQEMLDAKKDSNLADTYLNTVKKHTMDLAEEVVISQNEARFKSLESDSAGVTLRKLTKRGIRAIGTFWYGFSNFLRKFLDKPTKAYGSWTQKIPLRRLAEFHFCKTEGILKNWIDEDHRLVTSIITELEQFLVKDFSGKKFCSESESPAEPLGRLTEQLLEKVRNKRGGIDEQLQKDFETIHQDLFYYLERTGTLERRTGFYQQTKVERTSSRLRATLLAYLERWNKTNRHLLGRTQMVEEFLSFKKELEDKSLEFIASLESFFDAHLCDPLQSLNQELSGLQKKLREFENRQEQEAAAHLLENSKGALKNLVREIRTDLDNVIKETELSLKVNLFTEHALLKVNDLSEHGLFVYDMELERTPPSLEHKIIEWRLLVVCPSLN